MTEVHLIFPNGYDDPHRPSGGNLYDRQVSSGLIKLGWTIVEHDIPDAWPAPGARVAETVARQLAGIPDDRVVIFDGLLGAASAEALVGHADRLRLVLLVHMPDPPGGPPGPVLRAAQLVVTTSHWTAQTLIDRHGLSTDMLLVATPGAADAGLAIGTTTGGALLCVAPVAEPKGHDVLLAALAGLASRAWSCTCVGPLDREPAFVRRMLRLLTDGEIAGRVTFTGPMAAADLERAYAASDLLVLPTRLESYGMVITEALARGLPVIATSVGGVPEALGHAPDGRRPGILVEPDDRSALGAAIADWLANPTLRADLRSAARGRRATLGSWEQTVTTISTALTPLAAR